MREVGIISPPCKNTGATSPSIHAVCLRTAAVVLPLPAAAVGAQDARGLIPHQFMLLRALQGDDGAQTGTISLDDLLGAQGWKGHGFALSLSPRLTCKSKGRKNKVLSVLCKKLLIFKEVIRNPRVFKYMKTTENTELRNK